MLSAAMNSRSSNYQNKFAIVTYVSVPGKINWSDYFSWMVAMQPSNASARWNSHSSVHPLRSRSNIFKIPESPAQEL